MDREQKLLYIKAQLLRVEIRMNSMIGEYDINEDALLKAFDKEK